MQQAATEMQGKNLIEATSAVERVILQGTALCGEMLIINLNLKSSGSHFPENGSIGKNQYVCKQASITGSKYIFCKKKA